jgi:hypothetical protein
MKACEQNVRALSVFDYCVGIQGLYPLAGESLVPVDEVKFESFNVVMKLFFYLGL